MSNWYRFDASPRTKFHLGDKVFHGGDTFELEDAQAVDPRLVKVSTPVEKAEKAEKAQEPPSVQPDVVTDAIVKAAHAPRRGNA